MLINSFKIHLWLSCVFATAIAGAFFPRYDAAFVLLVTAILSAFNFIALTLSWRNRLHIEKLKSLSDGTAVAGLFVFLVMMITSGLLAGLVWLLAFVQLALNLTFKEDRHLYFGLIVSFVILFAGAAESKTGLYLVFIITYCVFTSLCLDYFYMDRRLQKNKGTTQNMLWPVASRIKIIIVLITLSFVIYLLMPRLSAGNLGSHLSNSNDYYWDKEWEKQAEQFGQGETESELDAEKSASSGSEGKNGSDKPNQSNDSDEFYYQGFGKTFDIRGEQSEGGIPPNVIVAYLQAEHGAYLRVETFDEFNGISWKKSIQSNRKMKLRHGEIELLKNTEANFRQNITIEENLGPYILATAIPVKLYFPASVVGVDSYQMIKIPSGLTKGTSYTVDSKLSFINGRLFSGTHYQPRKNDLQLPDAFDERVRELSKSITNNAKTELEKAALLESHLRENYQYSFSSIFNSQNKTPVAKFLFEDKKGHCEYFASSLTVMLRSIGIHARLVTGFSATNKNPLTGYHEIRVLDGHAWVEAWVDGKGWAVLEPTPFYTPPTESKDQLSAKSIQDYVEQLEKMYQQPDVSGDISLELLLIQIWQYISTLFLFLFSHIKLFLVTSWKLLVSLGVAFIITYILWDQLKPMLLAKLSYFKVSLYKPINQKSDIRFYMKHIQRLMDFKGLSRSPGTTIDQYATMLSDLQGLSIDKVQMADLVNITFYDLESEQVLDTDYLKQVFLRLANSGTCS